MVVGDVVLHRQFKNLSRVWDGIHFGPKCTFVKSSHFRLIFLMIEKLSDERCWVFVANHFKKLPCFVKKDAEFRCGNPKSSNPTICGNGKVIYLTYHLVEM